jgi:hypothetical protein
MCKGKNLDSLHITDRDGHLCNHPLHIMADTLASFRSPLSQTVTDIAMETSETVSDIPAKSQSTTELV